MYVDTSTPGTYLTIQFEQTFNLGDVARITPHKLNVVFGASTGLYYVSWLPTENHIINTSMFKQNYAHIVYGSSTGPTRTNVELTGT
jgi:hypothetical protein